jgi:putative ABC transport system permease protein
MPAIRNAVYASGGDQPVYNVETMQEFVSGSMARQRFSTVLLATFAAVALILAIVGTYGVVAYSTAQRAHEIGIRVALGAKKRDVLQLVIAQGVKLALAGVVIGTSAAFVLARILPSFSHLLFGIQANDPVTIGVASLVLLTSAITACYIPARRASNGDCATALRQE